VEERLCTDRGDLHTSASLSCALSRRDTAGVLVEERLCTDRGDLLISSSLFALNSDLASGYSVGVSLLVLSTSAHTTVIIFLRKKVPGQTGARTRDLRDTAWH
jgi:hypothetical protein